MNRVRESNNIQIWGNKESMNLNSMILTNIQSSTYFKQKLFELKTYHEVIDEIYYRVNHLEPWEKGSRRTQGLTVGGGGIVSTAYCLLYKLYTLKLTRKQVVGLITHQDSPYIRALGFMYVRYTQTPQDLLNWYYDYLDDEEELDVKAGGGLTISIGQMLRQWLTRLEWFDTLFPRIPVPIQNEIFDALRDRYGNRVETAAFYEPIGASSSGRDTKIASSKRTPPPEIAELVSKSRSSRSESRGRSTSRGRRRSKSKSRSGSRSLKRKLDESKNKKRHHRSRSRSVSSQESSSSSERKERHKRRHHKKRSDKDEDRHRHRHHRRHSRHRSNDDEEKRKTDSREKEPKPRKESKKNESECDSS